MTLNKDEKKDVLIKSREARRLCGGISEMTLYRWGKKGILTTVKINGKKYYRESEVRKLIDSGNLEDHST